MRTARFSVLQTSLAAITLVMAACNLAATTVTWVSGGPNGGYPSGAGYVDGDIASEAEYHTPSGLAIDETGNYLYVADRDNNAVRVLDFSIEATGTLLTYSNNIVVTNLFSKPISVGVDEVYNVFVLNRAKNTNGYILEFDYTGALIATNMAHITNAGGMALDPVDNIYVTASNKVFKISNSGAITTLATVTATNCSLQGICVKPNGTLAVCDTGRNGILLVNPSSGVVSTNAGFHGQGDFITLTDTSYSNTAAFFQPSGIAASGDGTLIVSDYGNDRVKAVLPNGNVTNVYGVSSNDWVSPYPGNQGGTVTLPDEPGGVASRCPQGVVVAPDGSVYTSEDYYHIIQHVTSAGFQAPPPPPAAPPIGVTATVVTNAGNIQVFIQWSPGATGVVTNYLVERSTSSNGPYTIIASTGTLTSFTDTTVAAGATYYYVVVAENGGGESVNSAQAVVTIPIPPPPPPEIGWYDFEGNEATGFFSVLYPVTSGNEYVAHNPLNIAVYPDTAGIATYYIAGSLFTNNVPASTVITFGSTPPVYQNNQLYGSPNVNALPFPPPLSNGVVIIQAVNVNGIGEASAVDSATFEFEVGTPSVTGANAAQFTLSDVTTNVIFYYTLDGTDPTNAPASQQVATTNGMITLSLNGSTNIFLQVRAIGYGPDAGFIMSGIAPASFTAGNFQPNTISWGFASGEGSSAFVGAAGETFYAPVTLTMLPNTAVYSLQFNMIVTNQGPGITNAGTPTAARAFGFQSMLMQPAPPPTNGAAGGLYLIPIPPLMFADYATNPAPSQLVTNNGVVYVDLETTNQAENLLAVGWLERFGFTNLYNTKGQTLITYSLAHDDLFPNSALGEPNGVIVGGYSFQIPTTAAAGQQYQIQVGAASATDNGIGNPGSSIEVFANDLTNPAALGPGSLNAIKIVTVGSIPYLVGDVYNFRWFNAGDFGTGNLSVNGSANAEQVFEAAAYQLNEPPPGSDFFDAMDSCGAVGILDANAADEFYGYYTNAGVHMTPAQQGALFAGDASSYSTMDTVAFGDGNLDISDVYVTYVRSLDPGRVWFNRLWTNGVRVAETTTNLVSGSMQAGVSSAGLTLGGGTLDGQPGSASITNTPVVNFTAGDYQASAGQTIGIPISASTFGPYPLRMMMMNVSVVPLDGSPALTAGISFSPNTSLGTAFGSSTPVYTDSSGYENYSAAWLPSGNTLPSSLPGLTGTANIGTLYVPIPANATSTSAYAIHFDHASGSPSGLLSFPNTTYTGLITLSSRTNSSYGDGIPDSWRLRYFGTIYNELSVSNANADGTGMNNWQKYLAGLNPVNAASVFNEGTDPAVAQSAQDAVIYWPSVSGKTYIIKRSSGLFPPQWTSISTNTGDGTYMEIHDSSAGNSRYYQVTTP